MLPLRLSITGLYSYQKEQVIEFDELLESQLFGIFGLVGTGKTAILEAISLSLYGKSERLGEKESRSYNILNLKSTRYYVAFEFIVKEQKFKFTLEGSRNKKNFDKVDFNRVGYRWDGKEYIPLASADEIVNILGLTYDNFKRTVIIPQGKFQEFIHLTAKPRTQMLKELFNLHKFELDFPTKTLINKNKSNLDVLSGKLQAHDYVSEELIKQLEHSLKYLNKEYLIKKSLFDDHQKEIQRLEDLVTKASELNAVKKQQEVVQENEQIINKQERELLRYELFYKTFAIQIKDLDRLNKEYAINSSSIDKDRKELNLVEKETVLAELLYLQLRKEHEQLPLQIQALREIEVEIQLNDVLEKLEVLKGRVENGKQYVVEKEQEQKAISQQLLSLEEKLLCGDLKSVTEESSLKLQASQYEHDRLLSEQRFSSEKVQSITSKKIKLDQSLSAILQGESIDFIKDTKKRYVEKELVCRKHIEELNLHNKLSEYREALEDGVSCPVCGADHHDFSKLASLEKDDLGMVIANLSGLQVALEEVSKNITVAEGLIEQVSLCDKELIGASGEYVKAEEQLSTFYLRHTVGSKVAFISWCNSQSIILKTFRDIKRSIEGYSAARQDTFTEVLKANKKLATLKSDLALLQGNADQLIQQSNVKYKGSSKQVLSRLAKDITEDVKRIEMAFPNAESMYLNLKERKTAIQSKLHQLEVQGKDTFVVIEKNRKRLQQLLTEHRVPELEVRQVLDADLDQKVIRLSIENHRAELNKLTGRLIELESLLQGENLDEVVIKAKRARFDQLSEEFKTLDHQLQKQQIELQLKKKVFEEKKIFLSDLKKLENRRGVLKELEVLFKGSGFVNYISSVKLHELCEIANRRFYKLTKQKMKLEVNEKNDFYVRDYFNDGRLRSIKTLSGGQTFQASLSLALALSEMVHRTKQHQQEEFFFLDEGFGTLDASSLNLVIDTLKALRKEGRVVGVISHVEELKSEIDRYLTVESGEDGTRVKKSWT